MTRFFVPLLALLALAAPALAQTKALPPGEIRANGDITFGNALKLGKREGNKTVITPDTLQILGPGSTGPVDGMSVSPAGGTTALSLNDILGVTIDIRLYGASPLKTALQNSTAIQAAFDAAAATGRDVFVPQGTFNHNGLTWKAASRLRGTGQASRLRYTGTTVGIAIADGANDFTIDHLKVEMTGDGSAFKFTGTNLRYEFANLVVEFPAYLGTAARRGFDYNLASGKYTAFAKFRTLRVFSAGRGIYVDPASSEVNNVDLDNVEFGACTRAVDARPAFSSGWTIKGGSAEVASDGETQWAFDNFHGVTMVGVRTETKNSGGWAPQVAGAYTSHSPVHFGPGAQKTAVIEPVFFPHTANVYLHEGTRKVYIHGQDGVITDAPVQAGSGTFGAVSAAAGTFSGVIERRGPAGTNRLHILSSNGSPRFGYGLTNGAEAGGNAGSDFALFSYADDGTYLSTPLTVLRSTGRVSFAVRPTFGGATPWDSANLPSPASTSAPVFTSSISLRGAPGTNRFLKLTSNDLDRIGCGLTNGAESGSNAGSDLACNTYTDTGVYLSTPLTITRSTGRVTIFNGLSLPGLVNAANDSAAATGGVPLNGVYRNGSVLMVRSQ